MASAEAAAWFGYWRGLRLALNAGWFAWCVTALLLDLRARAEAGLAVETATAGMALTLGIFLAPPAFVSVLCQWLSLPVLNVVGRLERAGRDWLLEVVLAQAVFLVPVSGVLLGVAAQVDQRPRAAVAGFLLGALSYVILAGRLAKVRDLTPHALTTGPLRERAFALAAQAKVKLRQIYLLPAGKWRMANAFAHHANNLLLTDYLVRNLARAEVDAVVAHELTHLKKSHPAWRSCAEGPGGGPCRGSK